MSRKSNLINLNQGNVDRIRAYIGRRSGENLENMREVLEKTPLPPGITNLLHVFDWFREVRIMDWTDWDPWAIYSLPSEDAIYRPLMPSVRAFLEAHGPLLSSFTQDEIKVLDKLTDLRLVHVGMLRSPNEPSMPLDPANGGPAVENVMEAIPQPPDDIGNPQQRRGKIRAYLIDKTCRVCKRQPRPWDTTMYASTTCVSAVRDEVINTNGRERVLLYWDRPHLLCERCVRKDKGHCEVSNCLRSRGRRNLREIKLPERYLARQMEKRRRGQAEQRAIRARLRRFCGQPEVTWEQVDTEIRATDNELQREHEQRKTVERQKRDISRVSRWLQLKSREILRNKREFRASNGKTCRRCGMVFDDKWKKYGHWYKEHEPNARKKRLANKKCDAATCQYESRDWLNVDRHKKANRCPYRKEWRCQRCQNKLRCRTEWFRHAKRCLSHGDHCGIVKIVDCIRYVVVPTRRGDLKKIVQPH